MDAVQKLRELQAAIRQEREAEKRLAVARQRIDELIGNVPEAGQRKTRCKTLSARDFERACMA